jgi:hypothetical protein
MAKGLKEICALDDRRDVVLLLRFHGTTLARKPYRFASYSSIAKVTKLTYNQVQHICSTAEKKAGKRVKKPNTSRTLEQEHIQYLLEPRTMELYAGKTMKERTILFHRKFSNKIIAVTSLRRLYLQRGCRVKKVRQDKFLPPKIAVDYKERCKICLDEIKLARSEGRRIIYVDETLFTKLAFKSKEWSAKNTNLSVDQVDIYTGYRAVIASMTEERGME